MKVDTSFTDYKRTTQFSLLLESLGWAKIAKLRVPWTAVAGKEGLESDVMIVFWPSYTSNKDVKMERFCPTVEHHRLKKVYGVRKSGSALSSRRSP